MSFLVNNDIVSEELFAKCKVNNIIVFIGVASEFILIVSLSIIHYEDFSYNQKIYIKILLNLCNCYLFAMIVLLVLEFEGVKPNLVNNMHICFAIIGTLRLLNILMRIFENKLPIRHIAHPEVNIKKIIWKLKYNSDNFIKKRIFKKYNIVIDDADYQFLFNNIYYSSATFWFLQQTSPREWNKNITLENSHHIGRIIELIEKYPDFQLSEYLLEFIKYYDIKNNVNLHILTAFEYAVKIIKISSLKQLLGKIVDIMKNDAYYKPTFQKNGYNMLTCLFAYHEELINQNVDILDVLTFLLRLGIRPRSDLNSFAPAKLLPNIIMNTLDIKIAKILIDAGIDINEQDFNGQNALYVLIRLKNMHHYVISMMHILINNGIDLEMENYNDHTALTFAIKKYTSQNGTITDTRMEIIKLLIDSGAKIDNYLQNCNNPNPVILNYYEAVNVKKIWKNRLLIALTLDSGIVTNNTPLPLANTINMIIASS
jgi:ankyrin repeat protein